MSGVPNEIWSFLGLGVVAYIGDEVLVQLGQKHYGTAFKIVVLASATFMGIKEFSVYMDKVAHAVSGWRF